MYRLVHVFNIEKHYTGTMLGGPLVRHSCHDTAMVPSGLRCGAMGSLRGLHGILNEAYRLHGSRQFISIMTIAKRGFTAVTVYVILQKIKRILFFSKIH